MIKISIKLQTKESSIHQTNEKNDNLQPSCSQH